jgi:2,5-dioxopentanoate dehydrogenase
MTVQRKNIIGSELSAAGQKTFQSYNPRQGSYTETRFHEADNNEIEKAAELAGEAAHQLLGLDAAKIADFLDVVREEVVALGDELVQKADEETALGLDRLRGERDRTVNQIKLFAEIVREGSWVDARLDTSQPDRKPIPKPDLRRMLRPLGPVAVFGASNFPLAFSVAGGDTASAFAAGNPVIVKAHPAHPGTSELVGMAITRAVQKSSLPDGTFSMLQGFSPDVSVGLVTNPKIKAVAFTGSLRAGRALFDAAGKRPEPIPVFSEMGSVNPVFLLKSAVGKTAQSVAEGLYRSVTMGVGQFCTCPGLVFGVKGQDFENFLGHLKKHFEGGGPGTMLGASIAKGYAEAFEKATEIPGVKAEARNGKSDPKRTEGAPGVMVTDAKTWLAHKELHEEIFGPATIAVSCDSDSELLECAGRIDGTLTATVHGTPEELEQYGELLRTLSLKAGRLLFNGYPTGVEVGYAMQHGGPYPASTDARFTSVGATAIYRFARPVCYQNFPDEALPPELQNANPRGIWRLVDGKLSKDALALSFS